MNDKRYFLNRVSPVREAFSYKDWIQLDGLDPYGQHRLMWTFFDLPRPKQQEQTPFLFRAERQEGLPVFYVLSSAPLIEAGDKWCIRPREYQPKLHAGDRLAFKLRANPVSLAKKERTQAETGSWLKNREKKGLRTDEVIPKNIRHDVVMDAKQRMGWNDLPLDERPSLAHVAYEAGSCWIREKEARLGCLVESENLRVDGHFVHCLKGRRDEQGRCRGIALSTLDFEGELTVTNPETFLPALFNGIGPAKSFGCGLLLVRRI
jgi:CRISPR system Cascade subunit CasE